jgi:hypothetical protein
MNLFQLERGGSPPRTGSLEEAIAEIDAKDDE